MIGAVLFDLDGTLVDSNDLHAACWQEAFRHFGIVLPYDRIRSQIGKGGDNLIPSLLPSELVERLQQDIEEYRSGLFEREYLPRVRPFAGAYELLQKLHRDDIGIVLATSSHKSDLEFHIKRLRCADFLLATVSQDDVERSKPCPDIFAAAVAKISPLGPDEIVVVGDAPWDAKAAKQIGLRTVAVRCGGFPDAVLIDAGAIAVYDGPKQLAELYPEWLPNSV
jgi:HAD superfamily hydrolase (TIGR01509 family)